MEMFAKNSNMDLTDPKIRAEFNTLKSKLFEINESFRNIIRVFK